MKVTHNKLIDFFNQYSLLKDANGNNFLNSDIKNEILNCKNTMLKALNLHNEVIPNYELNLNNLSQLDSNVYFIDVNEMITDLSEVASDVIIDSVSESISESSTNSNETVKPIKEAFKKGFLKNKIFNENKHNPLYLK